MDKKDFEAIANIIKELKDAGIGFDDDFEIAFKTTIKTSNDDDLENKKNS